MHAHRWQREFDVAFQAVREAALLARRIRDDVSEAALVKADASPVTVADFAVQALIGDRLARVFPDDPLVAEEDAALLRTAGSERLRQVVFETLQQADPHLTPETMLSAIDRGGAAPAARFWTLDPIDGTQGFLRGDQYVVALALIVSGQVEVAMLGCPRLSLSDRDGEGLLACAVRKGGAFRLSLTGEHLLPLHVSACDDPRLARVLRSVEPGHVDLAAFDALVEAAGMRRPAVLMDSQAKHALVAAGAADVIVRIPAATSYREKIWDQAAGSLIVEEAGGCVSDAFGARLDFAAGRSLTRNYGVVTSNGRLHGAVLDALRRVLDRSES